MEGPNVKIQKDLVPSGLDPADTAAVRAWIKGAVESEIQARGGAEPIIRILCRDKLVSSSLVGMFEVGQENMAAAYWHALGNIEGAAHRFRVATVLLGREGSARLAAVVMSWEPHIDSEMQVGDRFPKGLPGGFGARWWLAHRFFGQGGGGTGVLHGEWIEREGVNFDGLDEPFRELLDDEGLGVTLPPLDWQQTPGLDITNEGIMRGPGHPAPTTALGYARDIGLLTDREIVTNGIDCLWMFSFHGDWLEWWKIRGKVACSADDAVRNVAQFSGAEAIGVVVPVAAQMPDGSTKRALNTITEYAGKRAQRALVLDFGPDGKPTPAGVITNEDIDVPEAERWLGVKPGHDLGIRMTSSSGRGWGLGRGSRRVEGSGRLLAAQVGGQVRSSSPSGCSRPGPPERWSRAAPRAVGRRCRLGRPPEDRAGSRGYG